MAYAVGPAAPSAGVDDRTKTSLLSVQEASRSKAENSAGKSTRRAGIPVLLLSSMVHGMEKAWYAREVPVSNQIGFRSGQRVAGNGLKRKLGFLANTAMVRRRKHRLITGRGRRREASQGKGRDDKYAVLLIARLSERSFRWKL
jgi:hypothetical protein